MYLGPLLLLLREADTALRGPAPSIERDAGLCWCCWLLRSEAEAEVQVHFAQGSEPETASQWVDTDLDGSLDHADLKDKTKLRLFRAAMAQMSWGTEETKHHLQKSSVCLSGAGLLHCKQTQQALLWR
jgi:hypothetical protein